MSLVRRAFALAALVAFSACAHAPMEEGEQPVPVILISIDGFRHDYLEREITPVLSRLAIEGVSAPLRPSFPSNTFPNHYTMVTGVRPDAHGVINNRMEDPARPGVVFTLGDRTQATDPFWWEDGTPIWVSAERAGIKTGTMFWPGSEVEIHGVRPSQWRTFNIAMPNDERVDTLLSWFDLPVSERPLFLTLYFDTVDSAGHRYGPDSDETDAAIAAADAAVARLLEGLYAHGVEDVNLVIVSDHGMSSVSDEQIIDIDALAPPEIAHVVWDGAVAGIDPQPGYEAQAARALVGEHDNMECWAKGELPARFQYGAHRRVPAIVCLAELGWRIRSATLPGYPARGSHGYDPAEAEMAGIFIGHGPDIAPGVSETMDNVDIYTLLAELIGIAPDAGAEAIASMVD